MQIQTGGAIHIYFLFIISFRKRARIHHIKIKTGCIGNGIPQDEKKKKKKEPGQFVSSFMGQVARFSQNSNHNHILKNSLKFPKIYIHFIVIDECSVCKCVIKYIYTI